MADPITQVVQSLGLVTAYGYAKSKGYTGTEEEFAEAAAAIGQGAATASAAAEDASEDADTATTAAGTATTAAGNAENSATAALQYMNNAETAATNAGTAQTAAAGSATAATASAQAAATSEYNAGVAAGASSDYALDSQDHAEDSEAWAVGTKNGNPVPETADQYNNNAKYYAEQTSTASGTATGAAQAAAASAAQAEAWATGGSGGTAAADNNAAYYATQAAAQAEAAAGSAASGIAALANEAPTFDATMAYTAGDYVLYNNALYRFMADHAAGAWTGTDATAVKIGGEIGDLKESLKQTDAKFTNALRTGIIKDTTIISGWRFGYRHGNNGGIASSTNTVVTLNPVNVFNGMQIDIADGFKLFIADSTGRYPSGFQWQTGTWFCNITGDYYLELRKNDNSNISSLDDVANVVSISDSEAWNIKTAYVAANGSDNYDGTITNPFATISKAIDYGARKIMIGGGVYTETIDLQNIVDEFTFIAYEPLSRVIIKAPDNIITTAANLLSGYTRVKTCALTKTISVNNRNMYQEGIQDESTLITDAERMPIQRGYAYRCEDTLISKCAATSVNSALTEIENSDSYLWYYDTTNNTLYFSSPSDVSTSNPITYSPGTYLFVNKASGMTIHAYGIETKYHMFNVSQTVDSVLSHCKSGNVFGYGSFVYDRCKNVKFESCEAYRCVQNLSGDGFNGHGTNSGETFAYQVTCELFNCWAHDNMDDGYSDHEHAETIIIGGLYEYNGKGGVTPSYGSHCVCHDVYSRNNYAGFYYVGTAEAIEGGKYGQIMCYNCIADNNTRGGTNTGFRCGGAGNTMKLYNCLSINNGFAVGTDQNGGRIHVYGLKTGGNTQNIDGYATRIDVIATADFSK